MHIDVENPASEAAQFCMESYFAELDARFEVGFNPAQSISANTPELIEPAGLLLVARLRDEPIGCGALKFHASGLPAEIKRMWVSETTRGLGLGRRILNELEHRAQDRGVTTLRLETNRALVEAIRLYQTAGYVEVAAFNQEVFAHHWFEKQLVATEVDPDGDHL